MLVTIAKGIIYTYNRTHLDSSLMIAESFEHIKKIQNKITNEHQLQRNVINFIKQNIVWSNSQVNLKNKVNNQDYDSMEEYFDNLEQEDFDIELEQKIEIEKWYIERKCILEMYRNQEKNREKRNIFDCYFKKDLKTGYKLSKHLGINKTYCYKYIKEMKKDIMDYYIEYQSFIKNNNNK